MNEMAKRIESATIRIGDHVLIAGWPPHALEVIDTTDPALLVVIGPTGRELKVGRLTVAVILPKERKPVHG